MCHQQCHGLWNYLPEWVWGQPNLGRDKGRAAVSSQLTNKAVSSLSAADTIILCKIPAMVRTVPLFRIGMFGLFFGQRKMSTDTTASLGFRQVGAVTVDMKYHAALIMWHNIQVVAGQPDEWLLWPWIGQRQWSSMQ